MPGRFAWPRLGRGKIRARSPKSYRGLVYGAIGACLALVAVQGVLQFEWIGQVSESQYNATRAWLMPPMSGASSQFRKDAELLLEAFQATPDPSERFRAFRQGYLSWHALTLHGAAVKRILFYEIRSSGSRELTELLVVPSATKRVTWDEDLASVRTHIDELDFKPGDMHGRLWVGTWMFLPRAMVLYRPVPRLEPVGAEDLRDADPAGFVILQLDVGFLRDHVIPEFLSDHLWRQSRVSRFVVSVALNGENLWVYDPSEPDEQLGGLVRYALRPSQGPAGYGPAGRPDASVPIMLSAEKVPPSLVRFGAVQRVGLRPRVETFRLADPEHVMLGMESGADRSGSVNRIDLLSRLRRSGRLQRLFLVADERYSLELRATRQGVSLAEASNRRYTGSVALGTIVLLLLVGTVTIAALAQRNEARRAAMRVDAAASQSHQLRNPLAAITLLAENMTQGALGSGERLINYGRKIRGYAERLTEIVDRTARLAALDRPMRPYSLAVVDTSEVAREAFEEARPAIEEAGFTWECAFEEGPPEVRADAQALRQAVSDLLGNAVKYGLPGRWLSVETAEAGSGSGREVLIRVKDRGRGIPAHEAKMVFEPFCRGAGVADSPIPGSGLGLTLARNAVEGMGGRLTLESEVGRGSVFTISLPVPPPGPR